MAGQGDVHRQFRQLVAVADEGVGLLLRITVLGQTLRFHHGIDSQTAVEGHLIGFSRLLVRILEEKGGTARGMPRNQAGSDLKIPHADGVLVLIEIGDGVGPHPHGKIRIRKPLVLHLVPLGQPDFTAGHLVEQAGTAGVIPMPVGEKDLLDVHGIKARSPDPVDHQVKHFLI